MGSGYVTMLGLMAAATTCGLAIASRVPWSREARSTGLPLAIGFALGPYLLGLSVVAVLWLFPGALASIHLKFVAAMLLSFAIVGAGSVSALLRERLKETREMSAWPLRALLWGFLAALVVDSISTPLLQNDALEYAMVGRILFEARDLNVYPVLNGLTGVSGFYAPWTHPPLYVSLAYAGYIAQGVAETPHVFRLVAPWCLLAATWCTVCLGRRLSATSGVLSGILLASTPMLILGAASAQIDSLALLGLLLAFSTAVSVSGSTMWRGMTIGVSLGLALWSHSQAVVFPLLVIPVIFLCRDRGFDKSRPINNGIAISSLALLIAACVAAVPYGRNVLIFGSLISDEPPVFAASQLRWHDFFGVQRGLTDLQEIIQFGILKGFFATEIFAFTFWISLLGVPLAVAAGLRQSALLFAGHGHRYESNTTATAYLAGALLVLLAYLTGTAVSAALGTDVMIRNERYMLVLMPFAALLAAAGLQHAESRAGTKWEKFKAGIFLALMCALGLQLMALVYYRVNRLRIEFAGASAAVNAQSIPPIPAIDFLRTAVPDDAVVLALRPADMYYAKQKMVSYLDPRLLSAYAEPDKLGMLLRLQNLGITHVQVPDYFLPPVYNTRLMHLLADPQYTDLAHDVEGYQIYRLRFPDEMETRPFPCVQGDRIDSWYWARNLVAGSTRSSRRVTVETGNYTLGTVREAWNSSLLFRRFTVTELASHDVDVPRAEFRADPASQLPEFLLSLVLEGSSYAQVSIELLGPGSGSSTQFTLGGIPVPAGRGGVEFVRRFVIPADTEALRVFLEYRPHGNLLIRQAELLPACSIESKPSMGPG